ncbi:MFS transporter [Neorhizobium sp. DT-125]|uniref:MFS transporter n=1 Tax=Neorhizobium sp. DT-125 TaxID=3396163 RepID=UPI003F1CD0A0
MRFAMILALACQPYFAVSFLYGAVPAVLRQNGASLEMLGLFGLVFFAFTVNFLWAPVVDGVSPKGFGRRRFWLLSTQILSIILFCLLAWLSPASDFAAILAIGMLLAALAATQRSAILGFSADALGDREKAWGATAFGWGTAIGNIIGGALGLYLVDRAGWPASLLVLAGLMVVITIPLLWLAEPAERPSSRKAGLGIVADGRTWMVIAALTPATFGLAVAFAMTQPRLIDLGFGLTSIGAVSAAGNLIAATLAGPVTGWVVTRLPLRRVLAGGAVIVAAVILLLLVLTRLTGEWTGALAAVIVVFSSICALGIASNTLFLEIAGEGSSAATEVTFFSAAMSVVALAGFMTSGFIASAAGYGATLAIAAGGSAATGLLLLLPSSGRALALGGTSR